MTQNSPIPEGAQAAPDPLGSLSAGELPEAFESLAPPLPPAPSDSVARPAPPSVPPRTPAHLICMRGPCRHYWHVVTEGEWGNPDSTWQDLQIEKPREHQHICLRGAAQGGEEFNFSDGHIHECSEWDPLDRSAACARDLRRKAYYEQHPEHRPITPEELDDLEGHDYEEQE